MRALLLHDRRRSSSTSSFADDDDETYCDSDSDSGTNEECIDRVDPDNRRRRRRRRADDDDEPLRRRLDQDEIEPMTVVAAAAAAPGTTASSYSTTTRMLLPTATAAGADTNKADHDHDCKNWYYSKVEERKTWLLFAVALLAGTAMMVLSVRYARERNDDERISTKDHIPSSNLLLSSTSLSSSFGGGDDDNARQALGMVYLNSSYAFSLLTMNNNNGNNGMKKYDYSKDFFRFIHGLDVQRNQAYCAVATAAAILNSFREDFSGNNDDDSSSSSSSDGDSSMSDNDKNSNRHSDAAAAAAVTLEIPVDYEYDPYPYATQDDIFNECTNENVIYTDDDFDGILAAPYGLGMDQVKALLECHLNVSQQKQQEQKQQQEQQQKQQEQKWIVEAHHVDPAAVTMDQMRSDMKEALLSDTARVAVNFDRSALGQDGGGHWSPVGSYFAAAVDDDDDDDSSSLLDAFLIVDVAKYRYPAVWVPAQRLYESLATQDPCGSWKYPAGQNDLTTNKLLYPRSSKHWVTAQQLLQCSATYRGYVIVKKVAVPTTASDNTTDD